LVEDQVEHLRKMRAAERKSGVNNKKKVANQALLLSVTSGKGGVGKSNYALNMAIVLAGMKQKVLLIDADTNLANLDILLGINPRYNLSDVITSDQFMRDIIIPGPGGIDILPGSSGVLEMLDIEDEVQNRLIDSYAELEQEYNYIIIDTGAGLTPSIISYVISSDEVIIITNSEPTAITDAYAMIKVISSQNPLLGIRVLINMVDSQQEAADTFERLNLVVQNFLSVSVDYLGFVPTDSNVVRAVARQTPFVLQYPRSPASAALRLTTRKLLSERRSRQLRKDGDLFTRYFQTKQDK